MMLRGHYNNVVPAPAQYLLLLLWKHVERPMRSTLTTVQQNRANVEIVCALAFQRCLAILFY